MDENHNHIGGGDDMHEHHLQMWLNNSTKSFESIGEKRDEVPFPKSGSHLDEFNTSFQKLRDLHKELVSGCNGFTKPRIDKKRESKRENVSEDAKTKKEQVQLLLHVNKFCAPVPASAVSAKAVERRQMVAILDKKERENQLAQLTTLFTMQDKYKGLYCSLLKEHQEFKDSVQRSISSCKNELGITVESLLEAHKDSVDGVQKEKENLATQLQNAKREIITLECKTRCLEEELTQAKNQYTEKCKEADESHLNDIMVKLKCDGLNQAHNALYEHMTAAEQRNEVYKAQLAELSRHNASLLESIGKISNEHGLEAFELKKQLDFVVSEAREQREGLTATICELTEAFQYQVEYTKTVLAHGKRRESEYEEAQNRLASYIGKIIKECTTTVTFLEKGMKAGEGANQLLEKEVKNLQERLRKQEEEFQQGSDALCPKCQMSPETKSTEKDAEPEPGADTMRAATRISELARLREETDGRFQRTQVKYRKLFEKYTKCKEASAKKGEIIKTLQEYTRSLEIELQPLFNDQMYKLATQMEEAQLKHAQFQALLQGIDETYPKRIPTKDSLPETKAVEE